MAATCAIGRLPTRELQVATADIDVERMEQRAMMQQVRSHPAL
jgi:hypothetical protein